jgi:hypothetical protein
LSPSGTKLGRVSEAVTVTRTPRRSARRAKSSSAQAGRGRTGSP